MGNFVTYFKGTVRYLQYSLLSDAIYGYICLHKIEFKEIILLLYMCLIACCCNCRHPFATFAFLGLKLAAN